MPEVVEIIKEYSYACGKCGEGWLNYLGTVGGKHRHICNACTQEFLLDRKYPFQEREGGEVRDKNVSTGTT